MLKYAATVLIFISAGYFFLIKDNSAFTDKPIIVNNNIKIGTDKATLTLGDGTDVVLEKGKRYKSKNTESNGEEIFYKTAPNESEIAYHYLTIPRGGQYHVKLSDGTDVWLNSESKLKYPTNFTRGKTRKVELVYGEAYFDVSPSTNHNGSKFKVLTNIQEIEVLGTQFNVKAYRDEDAIYTTLIEGKVAVVTPEKTQTLLPNQQFNIDKTNNKTSISNINVKSEIAWVKGEFIVKHNLKDIMQVLSRWYDMDVTFANKELEKVRFVGKIRKNQNIVDILNTIKNFDIINNYQINNKKVILE
ncbi:FecR family protein [Polaribacter sp. Q13]|uniref:FecR family protein n=1 Tax=Polaribacter sp. Q13 TaxID=2806551 RepID=UPI00193B3950|nr:FecR family protein [Polaribacter sp. Q13]QVY65003.1 FecR family protein [Polaribacter sp. Q13]